jgi:hypothetical protein
MNREREFPLVVTGHWTTRSKMIIRILKDTALSTCRHPGHQSTTFLRSLLITDIKTASSRFPRCCKSAYRVPRQQYAAFRTMARLIQEEESRKIILEKTE